jgi:F0F1-type ATP synthase membrane subunit b/b'
MAIKLTKTDENKFRALLADAEKLQSTLEDEANDYNQKIADAVEHLNGFVKAYNEKLEEIEEFITDHATEWRSEWEDRSEAGQQNERGEQLNEFILEWENVGEIEKLEDAHHEEVAFDFSELPSPDTLPTDIV